MKALCAILCLTFSLNVFSQGGDEVRNGGGFAEQYLSYALQSLPKMIERCLNSLACARDGRQQMILKKIKASLPFEIETEVVKFSSNRYRPGYFNIDGVERLAVTGDYVGSPIYYNLDILYKNGQVNMSLGQAIQSLIHELGHHHGATDHDALDLLGGEVRSLMESITIEAPYYLSKGRSPFSLASIKAMAIGSSYFDHENNGTVILVFQNKTVDVGHHFQNILSQCDATPEKPNKKINMHFINLHWGYKANELVSSDKYLLGNVVLSCKDIYSRAHKKNFEFELKIKTSFEGYKYVYQSSELVAPPKLLYKENVKLLRSHSK